MKRTIDFLGCCILLVPISLFVFVVALIIILVDNHFPLFLQRRVGKGRKIFFCYKLQTMRPAVSEEEIENTESDKKRVTKFGSFLRDHGWDELPQIWNILLGDMSFIGPRPLTEKKIASIKRDNSPEEIKEWEKRFSLYPGITGWCQIHSRRKPYPIKYDIGPHNSWYEEFQILFKTFRYFLVGKHKNFF